MAALFLAGVLIVLTSGAGTRVTGQSVKNPDTFVTLGANGVRPLNLNTEFYMFEISDQSYILWTWTGSTYTRTRDWTVSSAIRPGQTNSIGVLARGAQRIFFINDQKRYCHFIWHLFVLGGTSCHYFAVLTYAGAS